MTGVLLLLGFGVFSFFVGFMSIAPEALEPRHWRRPEGMSRGEEMAGYGLIFAGGFFIAGAVATLVHLLLIDPRDPPFGVLLVFLGSAAIWLWGYDRLYQWLRRPPPNSQSARLTGALGQIGKWAGPIVLVVGLVVTVVS